MARRIINLSDFLSEELIAKYEFFVKSDFPTTANMSVDSFFPKLFNAKIKRRGVNAQDMRFNTSSFAISEFIANTTEVRKAHISELCDVLGYEEATIKRILLDVKRKNLDIFLVGFGGTGTNFNYWMQELCNWTNTVNVFDKIIVSDGDKFSLSNLVRIPFDYRMNYRPADKNLSFNNNSNIAKSIVPVGGGDFAKRFANDLVGTSKENNTIFYGAPDLATRKELTEIETCKFISATHSGDECQLYLNPPQDDSIQIETYGRINLSVFFMNHLKMTIQFLEFLQQATDESYKMSAEISTFDFKKTYNEQVDAGIQVGTKRLYRFPCLTREEMEAFTDRNNAAFEAEMTQPADAPTQEVPPVPEAPVTPRPWRNSEEPGTQNDGLQAPTELGSWDQLTDEVLDEIISGANIDDIMRGV